MKTSVIAAATGLGVLLLCPAVAGAADLTCIGTQTGGTFDNVTVPSEQSCLLDSVKVTGRVTVSADASLLVIDNVGDSVVRGDVRGDGCGVIELLASNARYRIVVGGNLNIQNCTGTGFSGYSGAGGALTHPPDVLIGGDVKCINNVGVCQFGSVAIGASLNCSGNSSWCNLLSSSIGGNVTLNDNDGSGISVGNTVIGGDLKCNGNAAAAGSSNTIAGVELGQCAGF
jgi:hypothetical protein